MAILIVDDESNTREALRELLTHQGHRTILEARNGEEALKIALSEKARIELIIADWEMPYMDGITFLQKVEETPALDLAPFVLITSDFPKSRLAQLQRQNRRLDAFLVKPFRMTGLAAAIEQAANHRSLARNKLLVLSPAALTGLEQAIKNSGAKINWESCIVPELPAPGTGRELLAKRLEPHLREIGALILDPSAFDSYADWLVHFRKTPRGSVCPAVCLSRDPDRIFPLRTQCQFFIETSAPLSHWTELLQALSVRASSAWTMETLFREAKTVIQKREFAPAEKILRKMLKLDPSNSEAHGLLADMLDHLGRPREALKHYRAAIELNPCLPRPYLKLAELLGRAARPNGSDRTRLAESAAKFCPQSPEVLLMAAKVWDSEGQQEKARDTLKKLLNTHPSHSSALELMASLSAS